MNTFFELKALQKGSDIKMVHQRVQTQDDEGEGSSFYIVGSAPRSQDLKTRPQLFYALYSWGQFYLQCFPEKTTAFLEYLAFMIKYGVIYPVPMLVKLDNKIRQFYVQHPNLNWDMTGLQVSRFLLDANIDLQQANSQFTAFNTPQKQKSHSRHRGGGGGRRQAWNQGQNQQRSTSGSSNGYYTSGTTTIPSAKLITNGRNDRTAVVTTISGSVRTAGAPATMSATTVGNVVTKHISVTPMGHKASRVPPLTVYRSGTVNSKSFVGKVLLRIKWKFELTVYFKHGILGKL